MTVIIEQTGRTYSDIWEMIEPSANVAMNLRVRSLLLTAVSDKVKHWGGTQQEAAKRLGVTQPRLNELLKGHIDRFSVDALLKIAYKAGLEFTFRVREAA